MNDPQMTPPKSVIFAYFANQATPLERKQTENWMETDEGLVMYFRYLDEWERQHPQFYTNTDQARQHFWDFMHQPNQTLNVECDQRSSKQFVFEEPDYQPTRWLSTRWLITVAASLLLVSGLWMTFDKWYYTTLYNGYGQIRSVQLPDGSGVVLGVQSTLRYARFGFGSGTRQVWLTGEARFEVVHQPNDRRFTVQTPDQTTVEVFGTTFLVNSRRHSTRVILEKGRIQLKTTQSEKALVLLPGDVVTVSEQGRLEYKRQPVNPTQVTWHDHRFVFNDTPLSEVVAQLNDTFGVTVQIPQPEIMTRTLSGTFRAETPDDLLQAVALMMNLQLLQKHSVYVLTWPGL